MVDEKEKRNGNREGKSALLSTTPKRGTLFLLGEKKERKKCIKSGLFAFQRENRDWGEANFIWKEGERKKERGERSLKGRRFFLTFSHRKEWESKSIGKKRSGGKRCAHSFNGGKGDPGKN